MSNPRSGAAAKLPLTPPTVQPVIAPEEPVVEAKQPDAIASPEPPVVAPMTDEERAAKEREEDERERAEARAARVAELEAERDAFEERLATKIAAKMGAGQGALPAALAPKPPIPDRSFSDDELSAVAKVITDKDIERMLELRGNSADLARWAEHGVAPGTHWIPGDTVICVVDGRQGKLRPGVPVPVEHLDDATTENLRNHPEGRKLFKPGEPLPKHVKIAPFVPDGARHSIA